MSMAASGSIWPSFVYAVHVGFDFARQPSSVQQLHILTLQPVQLSQPLSSLVSVSISKNKACMYRNCRFSELRKHQRLILHRTARLMHDT